MDEYNGKRAAGGISLARKGSALSFRDSNHEERTVQYCNRVGCSTRPNSMKGVQMGNPERSKYSRPSFRSSSSKAIVGSSTRPFCGINELRKPNQEQQISNVKDTFLAESSNSHSEEEDPELVPSTMGLQAGEPDPDDAVAVVFRDISVNAAEEVGVCSVTSSKTRSRRQVHQRSGSANHNPSLGLSVQRSFLSRNTIQATKSTPQGQGASANRCSLRNLGCASISDVLPSGCSSSDSGRSRRADTAEKRFPLDGESSARGKSISGPSSGANSSSQRNALTSPSLSFTEQSTPQSASRRTRNWSAGNNGVASVRTRRTVSGEMRLRLSEAVSDNGDNGLALPEPITIPELLPQTEFFNSESALGSSSQSFPEELPSIFTTSCGQPSSSSESVRIRPASHPEDGSSRQFRGVTVDRDGFRRFHMEGIAEMLLALERIEQDEELTYEQLLVLESNLFLGSLTFYDQHRDMRLDIDNMSYEELLALEERMGTVSTALSEEVLSNCLKRSYYMLPPQLPGIMGHGDDDIKCSICQEEYIEGDEVGKLGCEHGYHVVCIHEWLRLKNWCPICKAPASPSS